MKFIDMNKELKQKIHNLYNIVGEDAYLLKQAIHNLKSHLIQNLEEFNYQKVDASNIKTSEVDSLISTLPIGNEYRLVILSNPCSEVVKFLNKYDFSADVVVVCINADKLNNAEVIDCTTLNKLDISKYILSYCAKNGLSIEERAVDYLIDATNAQMAIIVNELNKLSAYAMDTKVITMEMMTNLIANTSEYAIYMLTSAIDNKDIETYQKIITEMNKSQSMNEIFSYMGKYFHRMQYIALNKNDEELSKILSIKPYAIKMSRQSIAKNGIKYYLNLYEKYVNLDYKIKSGKITANSAMYELIF